MQCVEVQLKIIVQGRISSEYLAVFLDIAAQQDPCEAHTHLFQAAAGDCIYLCASSHPDLFTASLIALSTPPRQRPSQYTPFVAHLHLGKQFSAQNNA